MKTYSSHTQAVVMARVHRMHALKFYTAPVAVSALVLVLALWGIGREVWVAHIVQNFDAALIGGSVVSYLEAAFLNTRFVVQVLVLLTVGAGIWLAYNLGKLLTGGVSRYI